jgi:hypothetical protein
MNKKFGRFAPVLLASFTVAAATPPKPYEPLAFLVGHCWQGTLQNGNRSDRHCFSWVYDQKFIRDVHVVSGDGAADRTGESIYVWNATRKLLEYLYIESDGGSSRGTVLAEGDTLVFPAASYLEDGKTVVYRSRWIRTSDDTYDVVTEFQAQNSWSPGFSFHMKKI